MEHIATPLGCVGLFLDGKPCAHDGIGEIVDTSDYARRHPVDGNWRIAYQHEPDGSSHTLECRLSPSCPHKTPAKWLVKHILQRICGRCWPL